MLNCNSNTKNSSIGCMRAEIGFDTWPECPEMSQHIYMQIDIIHYTHCNNYMKWKTETLTPECDIMGQSFTSQFYEFAVCIHGFDQYFTQ